MSFHQPFIQPTPENIVRPETPRAMQTEVERMMAERFFDGVRVATGQALISAYQSGAEIDGWVKGEDGQPRLVRAAPAISPDQVPIYKEFSEDNSQQVVDLATEIARQNAANVHDVNQLLGKASDYDLAA